jgi:rubrerythrin
MSHAREQIRDAVITTVTGLATTEERVFAGRIYPLTTAELPGLCVYTNAEQSELLTRTTLQRTLELVIEAYVKVTDAYESTIDTIAAEVELAIAGNTALNALVKDIHPSTFQKDLIKEGDKPIAIGIITFMCRYCTLPSNPETIK